MFACQSPFDIAATRSRTHETRARTCKQKDTLTPIYATMDTVCRTPSRTPSALEHTCLIAHNDVDVAAPPQPKFSEILAAELAGNFFRDLVRSFDDEPSSTNEASAAADWSRDIADLIHLSRQMQRDIAQQQQQGYASAGAQLTLKGATQPSGTTHRAFLVPPLFVDDEDILESYARDLVAEHFELATVGHQSLITRPPSRPPSPPLEPAEIDPDSMHLDLNAAPIRRRTPSVKSQLSTRTHSQRVYPKRHSCLPASKPLPEWKNAGLRQTKSARSYRTHCYDFGRVHPDLRVVATEDSVFPQRVERGAEAINAVEDECAPVDDAPVPEEPVSVARIVEKFEKRTKIAAAVDTLTWHDVLEINLSKVSSATKGGQTVAGTAAVIDQPTQTSPLSNGDNDVATPGVMTALTE